MLQVEKLQIGYGSRCVLKEASFSIGKGEIVGIIGCNGAGKSTLLKTIRGLLPKQGGRISYFGKPLEEYQDKELATKIAYLQQHVELGFGYTGKDIVMAGRYPYMKWWERESEADDIHISTSKTEGIDTSSLKLCHHILVDESAIHHCYHFEHVGVGDTTSIHHFSFYTQLCSHLGGTTATSMHKHFLAFYR